MTSGGWPTSRKNSSNGYEFLCSIITYVRLGGTLTRISTVIAVSVLGCQQMDFEKEIEVAL